MISATEKSVEEHPFLTKLLDNLQPVLKRATKRLSKYIKKTGKVRIKDQAFPLQEHEQYDVSVFYRLGAITNALRTLKNTLRFMTSFPRPRTYEKAGISQDVWIDYHFSYYIITFVSFADMVLILTNTVFQLGLREKDCKPDIIKNNSWIKDTKVRKALDKIDEIVKPYREPRNIHVHRGEIPRIYEFCNSELYDTLKIISSTRTLIRDFLSKSDNKILGFAFKIEIKKIITKLENDYIRLLSAIAYLFDELYKKYNECSKLSHELAGWIPT